MSNTYFVPNGDSRQDTAVLLVGTAREYGISQRSVKAVQGGFNISEELANIVFDDEDLADDEPADDEPKSGKSTKTSGNRAAKNKNSKEE